MTLPLHTAMDTSPHLFEDCLDPNDTYVQQNLAIHPEFPPLYSRNSSSDMQSSASSEYGPVRKWSQSQDNMSSTASYQTGYHGYGSQASDDVYDAMGMYTPSTTPDTRSLSRNNSNANIKPTQSARKSKGSGTKSAEKHSKSTKGKGKAVVEEAPATKGSATKKKSKKPKDEVMEDYSGIAETLDDTKRDKFLERNRVAASKCRQKKKEWVNGLEETKNGLESQNSHLQLEYKGLLGEVSRMKNELMTHASCNDPNIDKWIENEARRFVESASNRYAAAQAAAPPSYPEYGAYGMPPAPSEPSTYTGPAADGMYMLTQPEVPLFPPQQ